MELIKLLILIIFIIGCIDCIKMAYKCCKKIIKYCEMPN